MDRPLRNSFIPLCAAPLEFAPPDLYRDFMALPAPMIPEYKAGNWTEALSVSINDFQNRMRMLADMQWRVVQMLRCCELEAIGVETAPHMTREQKPIPRHFFLNPKTSGVAAILSGRRFAGGVNCTPLTLLLQDSGCDEHFTTILVIVKIAPFMFQEMKKSLEDQLIS